MGNSRQNGHMDQVSRTGDGLAEFEDNFFGDKLDGRKRPKIEI